MKNNLSQLITTKQSVIRRLSIVFNQLFVLPVNHIEVKASMAILMSNLELCFILDKEFVFGVSETGFVLKDIDLEQVNLKFGSSARELSLRGINLIIFHKRITEQTILAFLKIATLEKEFLKQHRGLVNFIASFSLPGINLFVLNYDSWCSFNSVAQEEVDDKLLLIELKKQLKSEEKDIFRVVAENGNEHVVLCLKSIYLKDNIVSIKAIITFIINLGCFSLKHEQMNNFTLLLSQLPLGLLYKCLNVLKIQNDEASNFSLNIEDDLKFQLKIVFENFFVQDSLEKLKLIEVNFSNDLYAQHLNITLSSEELKQHVSDNIEHKKNITQSCLQALQILNIEQNPADYESLLKLVMNSLFHFMEVDDFETIFRIYITVEKHSLNKESDVIKNAAFLALGKMDEIFADQLVITLLELWLATHLSTNNIVEKLLLRLNRSVVITQMKAYLFDSSKKHEKKKIEEFLSKIIMDISTLEADFKIKNNNIILDIIDILKHMKTSKSARDINTLTRHHNKKIKTAAFDALLIHETKESITILLSKFRKFPLSIFKLVAQSVVKTAYPDHLISIQKFLAFKDSLEREFYKKMILIESLKNQKNKHILPYLNNLLTVKPFFRKTKNIEFHKAISEAIKAIKK